MGAKDCGIENGLDNVLFMAYKVQTAVTRTN